MEDWYCAAKFHRVLNCMVERIVPDTIAPDLFDIYGVEVEPDGKFSETRFLDIIEARDRHKVKVKSWLRQILVTELHYKTGDYFARKVVPILTLTMVYDDISDQWNRLEIGESQKRIQGDVQDNTGEGEEPQ